MSIQHYILAHNNEFKRFHSSRMLHYDMKAAIYITLSGAFDVCSLWQ
jgi:hypothetical protein